MSLHYEIRTTEIKPYTYQTPLITINEYGEPQTQFSKHSPVHIKKLVLLNLVGVNSIGRVVSYEPLECVNRFLMSHHIDDDKQESEQYSKGLIHFFSFLLELQRTWDQEYDEELFDELTDLPRPRWDVMALRKSERITYQYRVALKKAVLDEPEPSLRLARTTATAYMNAVVKFYSFHIRNGYQFNNPPFDHELIIINYQAGGTSMKAYMSKQVHTTDLRLNFAKSRRNEGGALPSARRDLKPLTNAEWQAVENILINTQHVIKQVDGIMKMVSFPIEYCLFFLVCRYSGLRKEEAASLHLGQIVKPDLSKPMLRIGIGGDYGSLTKTKGSGNKSRRTILPSATMQKLYEYSRSDRYCSRLAKFKALCKKEREAGNDAFFDSEDGIDESKQYLFISQTGKPFFTKLTEINTRWNEVRQTVKQLAGLSVEGSPHNLRPTFGVNLFRVLLRSATADIALALVSECFGHEDTQTTLLYLKIAQDEPTGDEIYEDVLDYLGVFDELKVGELTHGL